jgi:thiol-disulfide isomerase/thioredoxin
MRNLFLFLGLSLFLLSCKKEGQKPVKVDQPVKQEVAEELIDHVPTLDYKGLKPWLHKQDDKVYVVNFWATWCSPCVKELPYFEKVNKEYKDKNVEVILVSLDFPKKKKTKLLPFIQKKNLQSKVLHLDDIDEQFWIADIDKDWSGALPATLIYGNGQRKFFEQSFTQEELENEIQSFIN